MTAEKKPAPATPTYGMRSYPERLRNLSRNCIQAQSILELQHGLPFENVVRGLLRTLEMELYTLGDSLDVKPKGPEAESTEWRELLQLHRKAVLQADSDISDLFERRLREYREQLLAGVQQEGPLTPDAVLDYAGMHGLISPRRQNWQWSQVFNQKLIGFARSILGAASRAGTDASLAAPVGPAVAVVAKAAWDEAWQMAYNDGISAGHPLGRSFLERDKEWNDSDVLAGITQRAEQKPSA